MNDERNTNEAQAVGKPVVGDQPAAPAPMAPTSGSVPLDGFDLKNALFHAGEQLQDELRDYFHGIGDREDVVHAACKLNHLAGCVISMVCRHIEVEHQGRLTLAQNNELCQPEGETS